MEKKAIWACVIVSALLAGASVLVACSPTPSPQPTTTTSVLPPPTLPPTPFVSVLPTPDPSAATVTGLLLRANNRAPYEAVMVFLERTPRENTPPGVLYAPPNDQPRAMSDASGEFIITNVPEGQYVAILYSPPFDLQLVTEPFSDEPMFINAEPGEVINIGTVSVSEFQQ